MRGSGLAPTAKKGQNPMLTTDRTLRPIAPGPRLLTAWRQVETLSGRPSVQKRFGGWSSGKSRFFREVHTGGSHAIGTTLEDASVHTNSL